MITGRIYAVVVTYNRIELLEDCLAALAAQTRAVDRVVVVDNASADSTPEAIAQRWPQVQLVRLESNEGSTGGYMEGMRAACEAGADWLWLLDDDDIARPDALQRLLEAPDRAPSLRPPTLLASRVEWLDGHAHPANQPIIRRRDLTGVVDAVERGLLPLRATSWNSLLISRETLERHAPPIRGFFYQTEDIEHTARLLRTEVGYLVPDSIVEHRTPTPHSTITRSDARRFYHHVRNMLFMLRGTSWELHEKPVWVWVLLESAVRFLVQHRFSPLSVKTLVRGVKDGLGPLPAP